VSPIHVMPKKAGVTVVQNKDGKLVPTRIQSGWRVCIDYRKLTPPPGRIIFHSYSLIR
jgi:hypothetical protein